MDPTQDVPPHTVALFDLLATPDDSDVATLHAIVAAAGVEVTPFRALQRLPMVAADLHVTLVVTEDHDRSIAAARRLDAPLCQAGAKSVRIVQIPGWTIDQTFAEWYAAQLPREPRLREASLFLAWLHGLDETPLLAAHHSNGNGHTNGHANGNGNGHKNGHVIRVREPDPWPALRLHTPPAPLDFPIEHFPKVLQDYAQEVARSLMVPVDLMATSMLAVASAAIGQSVNVWLKGKGRTAWIESPCLWLIHVARPGFAKSPAIRSAAAPLTDIDQKLREESAGKLKEWQKALNAFKQQGARRLKKRKINIDDPHGGGPPVEIDFDDEEPHPDPGDEPPQLRAVVKDFTRETLVSLLRDNPRGLLCDPDEASAWTGGFNEYKKSGKGRDREFWLSLFNSEAVSADRDSGRKSIYVRRPFVTVLAGTQPDKVCQLKDDRGADDGFLDRILWTCLPTSAWPRLRWEDSDVSDYAEHGWFSCIQKLRSREMFLDPDLGYRPWIIQLSHDAKAAMEPLHNQHCDELINTDSPSRQAGAAQKMRALAGRLALISSQMRLACLAGELGSPGYVQPADVVAAWEWIRYFRSQLDRIGSTVSGDYTHAGAAALLDWIRQGGRRTFRMAEVRSSLRRFRNDQEDLERAIERLITAGAIRPSGGRNVRRGQGLPSAEYEVNPEIENAPEAPEAPEVELPYTGILGSYNCTSGASGASGANAETTSHLREPGEDDE